MSVFVDEQKVPAEMELDDVDAHAHHVIAYTETGQPCGTGRLFSESREPGTAHIGRMAVLCEARGTGCGAAILRELVSQAKRQGYERVVLSAQTHALAFYTKHGFTPIGDEYLDANIPHQHMELRLE
jgi:predicted GNAT family N-acyltransferase